MSTLRIKITPKTPSMTYPKPGRPRKYHSDLERKTAKKEQAREWRLRKRRAVTMDKVDGGLKAGIRQYLAQKRRRSRPRALLTNEQRRRLAQALICAGANLAQVMHEGGNGTNLSDINHREAAQQIADWLGRLPHKSWDPRLPQPRLEQGMREFLDAFARSGSSSPGQALEARAREPQSEEKERPRPGVKVAGFDF